MSKKIHGQFIDIAEGVSDRLTQAISRIGPVRLPTKPTTPIVDTLFRAVAGQQLSTKAAATIWSRVVASAGDMELAQHVDSVEPDILRQCGLSASKTKAMKAIVAARNAGRLDMQALEKMSAAERVVVLTSIWGVGSWTADMMNLFYFREADVWPASDVTVLNVITRLTSKRRAPARTANLFSPYRSYLAMYMYRIADEPSEVGPDGQTDR